MAAAPRRGSPDLADGWTAGLRRCLIDSARVVDEGDLRSLSRRGGRPRARARAHRATATSAPPIPHTALTQQPRSPTTRAARRRAAHVTNELPQPRKPSAVTSHARRVRPNRPRRAPATSDSHGASPRETSPRAIVATDARSAAEELIVGICGSQLSAVSIGQAHPATQVAAQEQRHRYDAVTPAIGFEFVGIDARRIQPPPSDSPPRHNSSSHSGR